MLAKNLRIFMVFGLALACFAADSNWKRNVPESYRIRTNPYAETPKAAAAGKKLFAENCSQCHGVDALGKKNRPSLRTSKVQQAKDGELFWLLKNGDRRHGMPSWSSLPEPSRWQIVSYIKSLGVSTTSAKEQEQ